MVVLGLLEDLQPRVQLIQRLDHGTVVLLRLRIERITITQAVDQGLRLDAEVRELLDAILSSIIIQRER